MQDEIKVNVQGEPGANIQFGKNSSFRAPATINKLHVKIGAGSFLAVAVVALLMGPPDEPIMSEHRSNLSPPDQAFSGVPEGPKLQSFKEEYKKPAAQRLRKKGAKLILGPETLEPKEKIFFEPGTTLKAKILTGGALGLVKARLTENLDHTPIKAGSILIGKAEMANGRIQVTFMKAIVGNKNSFGIAAYAASPEDNEPGIAVSLWQRYGKKFGLSAGLYMISGMAEGLQTKEQVGTQVSAKTNLGNAALEGMKQATLETGTNILNEKSAEEPKPSLASDLGVLVVFDGEVSPTP